MTPGHADHRHNGPTQPPPPDSSPLPRPLRVFVLDDHELVRRGMRELLSEVDGFDVVGDSGSAREAAARIPALRPDVALLDVQLPDGSGIEVCRSVRAHDPAIRVLMVTSFDDEQALLAAMLAGASGLVLKQLSGLSLVEAVRKVAAGQTLLPPDAMNQLATNLRRQHHEDPRLLTLTGQERRILDLIVDGMTNRQIGATMHISEKTVKNHITNLLVKLGLQNRTQAAVLAIRHET